MSVEKMERYKENKKNRKEILRKEKRKQQLWRIFGIVCVIAIVGGIGFGVYTSVKPKFEPKYVSFVDWNKYIPDEV